MLPLLRVANDPHVPCSGAEQIAERAADAGVSVRTLAFEGERHGLSQPDNRIEARSAIVDFLDDHG